MFCTDCGKKLEEGEKYCTNCGKSFGDTTENKSEPTKHRTPTTEPTFVKTEHRPVSPAKVERWWDRLFKVFYIFLYVILPFILIGVWDESSCSSYSSYCSGDEAFWATLFTFIGYIVFVRLSKITILYIIKGKKVNWRNEFTSWF